MFTEILFDLGLPWWLMVKYTIMGGGSRLGPCVRKILGEEAWQPAMAGESQGQRRLGGSHGVTESGTVSD